MSEIDHYAKAQEMAIEASEHLHHTWGSEEKAVALTRLGQLFLDLHTTEPQIEVDEVSDEVYRVVAAWTGMPPTLRAATRALSEELYNALGVLSTATVNGQGRSS